MFRARWLYIKYESHIIPCKQSHMFKWFIHVVKFVLLSLVLPVVSAGHYDPAALPVWNLLLVDPVVLSRLPLNDFTIIEPESYLLLGVLNAVGTVANVTPDVDSIVTTDGTWWGCERVGGTEESTTGLDGITALPDHGADRSAAHILYKSWEEWLGREILIVLLEVLLAWGAQLDSSKLVATGFESSDNGANKSTLDAIRLDSNESLFVRHGVVVESS